MATARKRFSRPGKNTGDLPPIVSWKKVKPGTELSGIYKGMRTGKFGPLADFESDVDGLIVLGVPTVLFSDLSRLRPGAEVDIMYNGKVENPKTGREYHDFDVNAYSEDDWLPEGTEPVVAPARGDDKPIRSGAASRPSAPSGIAARVIRQAAPAPEPEPEAVEEEEADPIPPPNPAPRKAPAKGRTLKSVFSGLD